MTCDVTLYYVMFSARIASRYIIFFTGASTRLCVEFLKCGDQQQQQQQQHQPTLNFQNVKQKQQEVKEVSKKKKKNRKKKKKIKLPCLHVLVEQRQ